MKIKNTIKAFRTVILSLSLLSTLCMVSCDGMNDLHSKFTEGGEIVYLTKPDSVVFLPDMYSALIKLWIYNSPNTQSIDIYYNDGKDSLIVPVTLQTGMDSVEIRVPDLEELSYEFTIFTTDASGNRSIPILGSVNVIGEFWYQSLDDRQIEYIQYYPDRTQIKWGTPATNSSYTELEYDRTNGTTRTLRIPSVGNEMTELTDAVQGFGHLRFRTVYEIAEATIYREWLRYSPHLLVYPIGDATIWGWNTAATVGISSIGDDPNVYDFDITLTSGAVRFLTGQDWSSIQLWPDFQTNFPGEGTFQFNRDVTKNWTANAGNYHIHFDFNDMIFSAIKQ